jgi:STE24 endopeptidase
MPDSTTLFASIFIVALVFSVGMQLWLARRQVRHVGLHRGEVPQHFADRITLAAHRKAADYTIARARLSMIDTIQDAAVLLALTLGGGLAAITAWSAGLPASP